MHLDLGFIHVLKGLRGSSFFSPTETRVERGMACSKNGTSVDLSHGENLPGNPPDTLALVSVLTCLPVTADLSASLTLGEPEDAALALAVHLEFRRAHPERHLRYQETHF